ncbi:type II toxin-antitoxin system RelE/ParE family toxin [uncultured Amnibacterium sp.]|uniref:type II toxin-antitoxin system RelE family toxin n=1 Tax=uncultured Amnibacterium sp. TaxID=1631851 RepID=UPI0035CC575E
MARVVLTEDARDDLRALDGATQKIVAKGLKKLESEPEKRGAPLGANAASDLTGLRKLVVGDRSHRIIYRVEKDGSVCVVWVIGKRADGEVYDLAKTRAARYTKDPEMAKRLARLLDTAFERSGSGSAE